MRFARRFFHPYYQGQPAYNDTVLVDTLYVRMLKPTEKGAEVLERQRMRGKVFLGGGVIFCDLKTGKGFSIQRFTWCINLGMISDIELHENGKDFILSFHETDNRLNLLFPTAKKAKEWLETIFVEIRIQAQLFNNILRKLLPSAWMKVLKFEYIEGRVTSVVMNNGRSPIEALSQEERRQLNISDKGLVLVDTCLREEIDLWVLARGDAHPDVAEACERLSIWLLTVNKQEESDFWYQEATEVRRRYTRKMKNDYAPTSGSGYQSTNFALENIRNPPGMLTASTFLKAKDRSGNVNREERLERLLKNFRSALFDTSPTRG